jgi:hypothetical protein
MPGSEKPPAVQHRSHIFGAGGFALQAFSDLNVCNPKYTNPAIATHLTI